MFNYCKHHSKYPSECIYQFITLPSPNTLSSPTECEYTFTGTGKLTEAIVNAEIGTAKKICIEGYTDIGEYALSGLQITSVNMSNSVTYIATSSFYNCISLTTITIPDSGISIGSNAFVGCNSLTSITIPDSVIYIGSNAFLNSGLKTVTISMSTAQKLQIGLTSPANNVYFFGAIVDTII